MKITGEKYLLFAFEDYYPCGGWEDFQGKFESLDDAIEFLKKMEYVEKAHVVYENKIIFKVHLGDPYCRRDKDLGIVGKWIEEDENGDVKRIL